MSDLHEFVESVAGFYSKTAVDQLLIIAWYLEAQRQRPRFNSAYMRLCFKEVGVEPPDFSVYLRRLAEKKPPQLRKDRDGYCLAASLRRELDRKFGGEPTTVAVSQLLLSLPAQVPEIAERAYLLEALNCYKVRAYRASIIMAWNLAYDHLRRWVLKDSGRLATFNAAIIARNPKSKVVIAQEDDFEELKESDFIEICRTGNLLPKNTAQILRDKLTRRNSVAHPSLIVVTQHQADDAISDLVHNVILQFT